MVLVWWAVTVQEFAGSDCLVPRFAKSHGGRSWRGGGETEGMNI